MTLAEAKDVLRIDGTDNDDFIQSLLDAVPGYIEVSTGMKKDAQDAEPMVKTLTGFLLTLWYYSDHTDDMKLQRTIDNLLKCITLKVSRV